MKNILAMADNDTPRAACESYSEFDMTPTTIRARSRRLSKADDEFGQRHIFPIVVCEVCAQRRRFLSAGLDQRLAIVTNWRTSVAQLMGAVQPARLNIETSVFKLIAIDAKLFAAGISG